MKDLFRGVGGGSGGNAGDRGQAGLDEQVDLLATPAITTPSVPLTDDTITLKDFRTGQTIEGTFQAHVTRVTALFNSTGAPAISVPGGFTSDGFPIGLQLIGRPFEDSLVLGAAHAYEQATAWHTRKPPYVTAAAVRA